MNGRSAFHKERNNSKNRERGEGGEVLPSHNNHSSATTDHEDEGYWGRNLWSVLLVQLRHYALFLGNVAAWYTTNGMNGIVMQSLASDMRKHHLLHRRNDTVTTTTDNMEESVLGTMAVTCLVTALQLAAGTCLGAVLLHAHGIFLPSSPKVNLVQLLTLDTRESFVAVIHGVGSVCTNLGFMYGSASLVQILKLLEPFETLLFTGLLLPEERKSLTVGVISSMTLTIGAAVSLIQSRKSSPHPNAILFALCSGLTLSSRNVLQRKQHGRKTAATNEVVYSKVQKSLIQFTQLSWQSSIVMTVLAILLGTGSAETSTTLLPIPGLNWRVVTWHPLYNAFSMITLGFCSALTHSLLNAGKRVFAIAMAIVWFREPFSRGTGLGLALVFFGGGWYTVEAKAKEGGRASAAWMNWIKPLAMLVLLQFIFMVQAFDQSGD